MSADIQSSRDFVKVEIVEVITKKEKEEEKLQNWQQVGNKVKYYVKQKLFFQKTGG